MVIRSIIQFEAPPLPHYLISGQETINAGECHVERTNIGVFDLLLVTDGCLFMGENKRSWKVGAGEILLLRPDMHHYPTSVCKEVTKFYWLHFQFSSKWEETESESEPPSETGGDESEPFKNDMAFFNHFGRVYRPSVPKYWKLGNLAGVESEMKRLLALRDETSELNCWDQQASFHNILKILNQESREIDISNVQLLAEQVMDYLRRHFQDPISHETLHKEFHFHPVYITRCMQKFVGCTPMNYLQRYRIQQSKFLLANTVKSISAIAGEVGFESNSYFTRCFQKLELMSPREYRNQFRP
jgi:AraC-like DNA-binding protein